MLDLGFLYFLADPLFVVAWYLIGAVGAAWVWWDLRSRNPHPHEVLKRAWPVVVLFFSLPGLLLYVRARPPGRLVGEDAGRRYHAWASVPGRIRMSSAVISFAGAALGIVLTLTLGRLIGLGLWAQVWLALLVASGIAVWGFRRQVLQARGYSWRSAMGRALLSEVPTAIGVVAGMAVVSGWIEPRVVGAQPGPWTLAFWGFLVLGLAVGFVLAWPVNNWLLGRGWRDATV